MKRISKEMASIFFLASIFSPVLVSAQDGDCGEVKFNRIGEFPRLPSTGTKIKIVLNPDALPRDSETYNALDAAIKALQGATSRNLSFELGSQPASGPYINLNFNYKVTDALATGTNNTPNWETFQTSDITIYGAGEYCSDTNKNRVPCFDPQDTEGYKAALEWLLIHELLHSLGVKDSPLSESVASGVWFGTNNKEARYRKLECVLNKLYMHSIYCG